MIKVHFTDACGTGCFECSDDEREEVIKNLRDDPECYNIWIECYDEELGCYLC